MKSRTAILLFVLLLAAVPAPAGPREDLYAALEKERATGDLAGALALYRKAAASEEAEVRTRAILGSGRCLRLLGEPEQAREELNKLLETELAEAARRELEKVARDLGETPPEESEADALRAELSRARAEARELREKLAKTEGDRDTVTRLRGELTEKDALVSELSGRLREFGEGTADGRGAAEAAARERDRRAELAAWYMAQARAVFTEMRFDEARAWAKRVLELEPTNAEARELLLRVGDSPSGRDRLVRAVRKLLDEERRLHLDKLILTADALISTGEAHLRRGELEEAVARLDECVAVIDGNPAFDTDLSARRRTALELRKRALLRMGGPDDPMPPLPEPVRSEGGEWRDRLRKLLVEVPSGPAEDDPRLRIHDLTGFVDTKMRGEIRPGALSVSPERPAPGRLIADLLPQIVHPPAWKESRCLVEAHGEDLIVFGPEVIQNGIADLLSQLGARQNPPTRVTLTVIAAPAAALSRATMEAGLTFRTREGGAWCRIRPAERTRLLDRALAPGRGEVLGRVDAIVPPERTVGFLELRSLNITAPPGPTAVRRLDYGLSADVLPIPVAEGFGVAVRARVTVPSEALLLPAAPLGEQRVPALSRMVVRAATVVEAGGSIALTGLANPFAGRQSPAASQLLLLITAGVAPREGGVAPAPSRPEGPVPVDLGPLYLGTPDDPAPPFRGEASRPSESRAGFLLGHIRELLGEEVWERPGASLTLGQGVLWVAGGEDLVVRVKEAVEGLLAARDRLVRVRVRAARISAAEESVVLRNLPSSGEVIEGEGVRLSVLSGEERDRVVYGIAGAEGRIPYLPALADAHSTQLVHLARVTTSRYLKGRREGADGTAQPVYGAVDEGIAVEMRPVVLPGDRVDLRLEVRIARILTRGAAGEATGPDVDEAPVQAISSARLRAVVARDETIVVTGIPAPTPGSADGRRNRLVLLVEAWQP